MNFENLLKHFDITPFIILPAAGRPAVRNAGIIKGNRGAGISEGGPVIS
jgi:hypothetical protein